ncbi:MAG: ATP-binding protein [bacterium]
MMIRKRQRKPIRGLKWTTREWRVMTLSLVTAFIVAAVGAAINFNQRIAEFFRPHAKQPLVQFMIQFLVVWLIVLLILSYLRWRKEAMKNAELEDIVDSISPDVLLVVDEQRQILMSSVSVLRMFGYGAGEILDQKTDILYGDRRRLPNAKHEIYDALEREGFHIGWATGKRKDGRLFPLEIISGILKRHGGSVLLLRDITERKDAEQALLEREMQLRQSQKMEALGLLAGGVAHDFNNLLTSILGFSSLALEALPAEHPARADVQEVLHSAERAVKLTSRLLAVGRKQVMQICSLDLNSAVDGMTLLLKRTMGEDIVLDIRLDKQVGMVESDAGGIEQIILNLAVNARDAMPRGGTLLIETRKVTLDETYCRTHVAVEPGAYGQLLVRDSGCGMRKDVQEHIFEPFFTTKEKGKGTGLGLSMVYGIIRQCGGYIEVESEPDAGTVFKLYFRTSTGGDITEGTSASEGMRSGFETLLVVEDDNTVRSFAVRILSELGYRVLETASPEETMRLCREHQGRIHMIVADVVLPGMSGVALAQRIREFHPAAKVLHVTGVDQRAAMEHGLDLTRDSVLMKPYTQEELALKVRQILDAATESVV